MVRPDRFGGEEHDGSRGWARLSVIQLKNLLEIAAAYGGLVVIRGGFWYF